MESQIDEEYAIEATNSGFDEGEIEESNLPEMKKQEKITKIVAPHILKYLPHFEVLQLRHMKLLRSRGGSRAAATSKMERFVIIVNGFQPLTIITKRSILDVAAALDPSLEEYKKLSIISQ